MHGCFASEACRVVAPHQNSPDAVCCETSMHPDTLLGLPLGQDRENRARSSNFSTLPAGLRGSSSTISTCVGNL